jgi:acyl-CoA reductase-like NAD-dependent aldehyde dehydrogenase
MSNLISLPNYVNGSFRDSKEKKILRDYKGKDFAVIYNVSPSDLREAKRNISIIKDELKGIELNKIINLLKKSMNYYFTSEDSFITISKLTGSPYNYVKKSVKELKEWVLNIEDYLKMCFNKPDYNKIPLVYENKIIAYEKYVPYGPVIGVLPKNSEAESIYLILQILLAKSPSIIKTSSSLGSNFSSLELVKALNKTIDELKDPELEIIKRSVNIVNIFNTERDMIIKKLEVEKASYVIFGSNRTIEKVEDLLKGTNPNKIIKMGTGLSISVVLKDADIKFSTEEICTSASIDRGNDCVSSNIVYVEEGVFKSFMSEAKNLSYKYESKDPFSEDNIIGHVHKDDIDVIKAKLTKLDKHRHLKGLPETLHLSIIELEEHHHFEEFPGPVLGIRKFKNLNHFFTLFKKDLERNKLEKNLVSAVFTRNESKFEEITNNINSYTFKLNKGSEKMNFLLEHQGTYIIKELLDKRIIEK